MQLLALLVGLMGLPSRAPAQTTLEQGLGDADLGQRCQQIREEAYWEMDRLPRRDEKVSPNYRGRDLLEKAADVCWRAALRSRDPETAAELAASGFLCRDRRYVNMGEMERVRQNLSEAIEKISGLHNDRSPALVEVLKRSAYVEWGAGARDYADGLLRQALEIARATHGPEDPRVADLLNSLAFLYAPSDNPGSTPQPWQDAEKAEALYRQALEIHLLQEDPHDHESYSDTLIFLRNLYRATSRGEEAKALEDEMGIAIDEMLRRSAEARQQELEARQRATAEEEKAAGEPTPESADEGSGDG
jgi:hypothetical protein